MSSQPVTVMCSACDILPSSVTSRDNPRQTTTRRVRLVRRGDNSQWRDVAARCDADDGYSCSDLPPPLPPGGLQQQVHSSPRVTCRTPRGCPDTHTISINIATNINSPRYMLGTAATECSCTCTGGGGQNIRAPRAGHAILCESG